jgi:hypothetical protein
VYQLKIRLALQGLLVLLVAEQQAGLPVAVQVALLAVQQALGLGPLRLREPEIEPLSAVE